VQGLGGLQLDLGGLPVDIAAAGCHKWLLAPGGLGVLYVHPDVLPRLAPINVGWNSVTNAVRWEELHFDLKADTSRFEEGTPNVLGTAALRAAVRLLEEAGFGAVDRHILALADRLRDGLRARGYRLLSPEAPGQKSGIVAFQHPRLSNENVLQHLSERDVRAAVRGGNVRFSPHIDNDEADIERALSALPA